AIRPVRVRALGGLGVLGGGGVLVVVLAGWGVVAVGLVGWGAGVGGWLPVGEELVQGDGDHDGGAVPVLAGEGQGAPLVLLGGGGQVAGGQGDRKSVV